MASTSPWEPEGPIVSSAPALAPDAKTSSAILGGSLPENCVQSVTLVPLSQSHAKDLYTNLGGAENAHLYKYLPTGPYDDVESFAALIKLLVEGGVFFSFAILSNDSKHITNQTSTPPTDPGCCVPATPAGIICFLNIVPDHRTIEIGHVLFSPTLQRSTAATEASYLLMKHAFEDLGYRRVEWKANDLNVPSKRAALRLGFVFEGVFRKHMVVKERNRDTAWFSVTDDEWVGGVKKALEEWLDKGNFDGEGKQKRKLEEIREGLMVKERKTQQ